MLWLPHPAIESQLPPVAVSDASVLALEWMILAPRSDHARWSVADTLLYDPWFVAWVDRTNGTSGVLACNSLVEMVDAISEGIDDWILAWAGQGDGNWKRLPASGCGLLARQAAALALTACRADEIEGPEWHGYVQRCRDALTSPPQLHTFSAQPVVSRYLVEQLGCERRVPALASRLAGCDSGQGTSSERFRDAKLASLQELAYGASHEINNPLANIAGRAQALLIDETAPDRRRALESIHRQALRAHEMISDLMLFARPPKIVWDVVDIAAILRHLQSELLPEASSREVELQIQIRGQSLPVAGDTTQIEVAVRAGIINAIEAVGQSGQVSIEARLAGQAVVIEVSDNGPGLNERELEHAFDPFFSGREAGRGLGFGLTKCWRIVSGHGGHVTIRNQEGGGALLIIELPVEKDASISGD